MKKFSIIIFSFLLFNSISAQMVDSIFDIRDGQVYKIVKIAQQWWMQENLNVGTMIDNTKYWSDNDTIEKYCYSNNENLCNIYGGLYSWYELMDYGPATDTGNPGTTRGICPIGWHLPTYSEWIELVDLVGGESGSGGGFLKETGTAHWTNPNTGATNMIGFTALGAGYRSYGSSFTDLGNEAFFWSSTNDENPMATNRYAWYMTLSYNDSEVDLTSYVKDNGFSVRCLRDTNQFSYLTISDENANALTNENFINERYSDTIVITNSAPLKTINIISIHTASQIYSMNKSSAVLSTGDSIHVIITFNSLPDGIYYFDTLNIESDDPFTPVIHIPLSGYKPKTDSIIDIRDQRVYKVVKIGQQWWMQENMNFGKIINLPQDASDNGIIEKYCYFDNLNNCKVYGGLYQWDEMMDYNSSENRNPGTIRGICPAGWHLPTYQEWEEIVEYLGGASVAGGKLKETGIEHWWDPNTDATNENGFTALPGGALDAWNNYYYFGYLSLFWSSTQAGTDIAFYQRLMNSSSDMFRSFWDKGYALSVRCLTDDDQFSYLTVLDNNFQSIAGLNFYNVQSSKEIIIINSGVEKTINISSISTKDPAFDLNYHSAILSSGDSIQLNIAFNPPVKDIYPDILYISSDDPYNPLITIPLNGTFPPEISFADSSNISCSGYSDGSATVSPSYGTSPYQYQWNDIGNTTGSTVSDLLANKYYRVTITDALGWTVMDSIKLSEPEPLHAQSDYSEMICPESDKGFINLDPYGGTPPYIYSWSNGAETQNISGLSSGNYSVTIGDKNHCENPVTFIINNVLPYDQEKICIVTIDLLSGKNIVVWEKSPDAGITSYNIYREREIGRFEFIGSKDANDLSIFRDETADPESRAYLYKITITDTCGNNSYLSSSRYHKPSFLQYVSSIGGINLSWTDYVIEGIDNLGDYLSSYVIYRGTDSTGLTEYATLGSINNYTDKDPEALIKRYYYRVAGVFKNPCYPTGSPGKKDEPGPYTRSMSNIEDNRIMVGINQLSAEKLSINPVPFSDRTIITFNNPEGNSYTLYLMDLSGKVCRIIDNISTSVYTLEREDLSAGFYIVEIRGEKVYWGRIIVE